MKIWKKEEIESDEYAAAESEGCISFFSIQPITFDQNITVVIGIVVTVVMLLCGGDGGDGGGRFGWCKYKVYINREHRRRRRRRQQQQQENEKPWQHSTKAKGLYVYAVCCMHVYMSHILLKRNRFLKKFIIFGDFHQNGKNKNEEEEEAEEKRERENSSVFLFIYIDTRFQFRVCILKLQKIRTSRVRFYAYTHGRQVSKSTIIAHKHTRKFNRMHSSRN